MPEFSFTITAPATISATVVVEADTIAAAQDIALQPEFYNDASRASFEFDDGNTIDDVYLPDSDDFEIVDPSAPKNVAVDDLRAFWRDSELANDFFETFATGVQPAGGVFDGRRIVLANGDRSSIAQIDVHAGQFRVTRLGDPLLLADPEADVDMVLTTRDASEAFLSAVETIGLSPNQLLPGGPGR